MTLVYLVVCAGLLPVTCMPLPCALLIDDHAMFRAGLRQVIKVAIPELDIFEAGSLDEALGDSSVSL